MSGMNVDRSVAVGMRDWTERRDPVFVKVEIEIEIKVEVEQSSSVVNNQATLIVTVIVQ